jgi:hypothetical protein
VPWVMNSTLIDPRSSSRLGFVRIDDATTPVYPKEIREKWPFTGRYPVSGSAGRWASVGRL